MILKIFFSELDFIVTHYYYDKKLTEIRITKRCYSWNFCYK
ncbi:hypothetical protein CMALT430_150038 [Carnobacterium maltaromaticum]|nr:hypothetical protein CMALT430_150038 [Carnobacterium maltaromaticum]